MDLSSDDDLLQSFLKCGAAISNLNGDTTSRGSGLGTPSGLKVVSSHVAPDDAFALNTYSCYCTCDMTGETCRETTLGQTANNYDT